jgi:thioredoxin reductase
VEQFSAVRGRTYHPKGVPLTLEDFLDYAAWFQQQAVPDIKDAKLTRLRQTQSGFELKLDNGETAWAKRVIMAVGHLPFRYIPAVVSQVSSDLVSHSSDHSDLSKFAGKDVTIVGCGQSGLETAALLHEAGANVRVLARGSSIVWNEDVPASSSMFDWLLRPDAGLGPGWRNLIKSELPRLFYFLPAQMRQHLVAKTNGPAGSWWLKNRMIGKVPMLTAREVIGAEERDRKLQLSVRSPTGVEQLSTDHLIAATGYKVDVSRLGMIEESLRSRIETYNGAPVLKFTLESSVPGLYFVGLPSALSFGPVMRFVHGTKHAATILASHLGRISQPASKPLRIAAEIQALK